MKNAIIRSCALLLLLTPTFYLHAQENRASFLHSLPGVKVEVLTPGKHFTERYLLWIEQPVDHLQPSSGTFQQRVLLSIRKGATTMIFNTDGYDIEDYLDPDYVHELSTLLEAHQLDVEHRYYPPSSPQNRDWTYLTVAQAAADHHRIVALLKPLFQGAWVGTGISKGGQAAMFHRYYYPDDVDITVGYVCPLAFSTEDLRVYSFLREVGDTFCRTRIRAFQERMLREREELMPAFIKAAEKKGLRYFMGYDKAYELLVLEYAFAFWQWGSMDCSRIPLDARKPSVLIGHLDSVADLEWVSEGFLTDNPFFYQALTEIGMYGYDTSGWHGLLRYMDVPGFEFACPSGTQCLYNPETMQKVDAFVRHHARQMLFLYGEYDPWSATAVQWSGNPGVRVHIHKGGSHRTRIMNLDEPARKELTTLLKTWLTEIGKQK